MTQLRLCYALVAVGAAVRVALAANTSTYIPPDGLQYLNIAQSLLAGDWGSLPTIPHYLYGVATALVSLGILDLAWAGRIVSLLAGFALVGVVGVLGARLGGREAGWAAAALAAVFPPLVDASAVVLSESLFLVFSVAGILWGLDSLEGNSRFRGSLAGGVLGLAFLTRPEGFALVAACVGLLVAFHVAGRLRQGALPGDGRPLDGAAFVILGFAALAAPYVVYVHAVHGSWVLSGYQLHAGARALTGAMGVEAAQTLAVGTDILYSAFDQNPVVRAVKVIRRAYLQGIPWLLPPLVLLVAGVGIAYAAHLGRELHRWIFLAPFLAVAPLFAAVTLPLVVPRYYLLTAALLLPVAGVGVVHMGHRRAWLSAATLLVLALSLAPDLWRIPATAARPSAELVRTLQEMAEVSGGTLVTNSPGLLYLSGMESDLALLNRLRATSPDSLAWGVAGTPRYVAIQLRGDPTYAPGWDAVAREGRTPRGMEAVGTFPSVGGTVVVYRVVGSPES